MKSEGLLKTETFFKRIVLFLLVSLHFTHQASASHIAGGDFSVRWISGNNFEVTLKMFRDCTSGTGFDDPITITVYDNVTNAFVTAFTMPKISVTPIALGDACFHPPSTVCIEQGLYQTTITLTDNPNGYYLAWERCCRNASIQNIVDPSNCGMVFYVQVPDPALHNSTPVFGSYPADGYLCQGMDNFIDFDVTETDGDSLVYSLITPLQGAASSPTTTSPTTAGTKPYPTVTWLAPYSLADIVGGTPPMAIDPVTGVITCKPTGTGVFVFAVMIEEYRAGVKISETIRDIQYYVLNCIVDEPASVMLPDTINVAVNGTACFDVVVLDQDLTDTVSILVSSPTFADGATVGMPLPYQTFPDTTYQFFFTNETTGLPDSVVLHKPTYVGGAYYGEHGIGLHYCWATSCEDIVNNPWELNVSAFSLGCSGDTNFLSQTTEIFVVPAPLPDQHIFLPDTLSVIARNSTCFDMVVLTDDPADTVNVMVHSSSFGGGAVLVQQPPVSTSPDLYQYTYYNASTGTNDSVLLTKPNLSNGVYSNTGGVGFHYCWETGCEDISEQSYHVTVTSFRIGCFGDTTKLVNEALVQVKPPKGLEEIVPNVFSPNGDHLNDTFKLKGIINYCYDSLTIQVYNRWGQLIFESNDPAFTWDGKNKKGEEVSEGTYYVVLNGIFGDADVTRHYPIQLFRNK